MDKPIPEAVELLRAFQSQFGARRPDEDEDDAETWDRIDAVCKSLTAAQQQGQPAAAHEPCAAVAAIQFALTDPEGMTFLRLWNEGEFDTLRREWPDAPSEVYVGADPLAAQRKEPTT